MDIRSNPTSRLFKITDEPEKYWRNVERLVARQPIFKRISATHVRVRLPSITKEPISWTVLPYEELRARLNICIRDVATEDSTERFVIEVSVGKDSDTDWIFHHIEASPLEACDQIVEEILSSLDDDYSPAKDVQSIHAPKELNDVASGPEPITPKSHGSSQSVGSPHSFGSRYGGSGPFSPPVGLSGTPVRKLAARVLRWTWNAAALTAIACAIVLVLPLNRLTSPQQASPSAHNQSLAPVVPVSSALTTHGYVPPDQLKSLQVLGSFAGLAVHEGDTPTPGQAPSIPTFYLFSSLNCQDCGAVEHMLRTVAQTRKGYVIPVGFSMQPNQQNGTAIALSQVYCANPRQDAYLT